MEDYGYSLKPVTVNLNEQESQTANLSTFPTPKKTKKNQGKYRKFNKLFIKYYFFTYFRRNLC
jgi:hypothetical protein